MAAEIKVGVISDTHGLLRPAALFALSGADHIIHAGDIGSQEVIEALLRVAPVTAIRGNVDHEEWACRYPETQILELGQARLYIIHDLNELEVDPLAQRFAAVVSGHSHVPKNEVRNGVLYFNPGSAGPRRFHLPVALGFLTIRGPSVSGDTVLLKV